MHRLNKIRKFFTIKKIIILLVVLGLLWFGYTKIFGSDKSATPIEYTQVKRGDVRSTVTASGTLVGKAEAELKFKIGGKLAYLAVKQGDKVQAGELIANLDAQELNIALQQANNTLRDKQAAVDKILDDVKDSDSDETFSEKQQRTSAEVARDNAFDNVKAAKRDFQDAVIYSPIAGTVIKAEKVAGQTVSGADVIADIVDESDYYFDAEVDESDIGKVKEGQQVDVSLNSYPDQIFKGSVEQVKPIIETTSSGATVVIVRVNIGKPNINFVHGLNGQAAITYQESQNTLFIPVEALKDDNTVVVQDGDTYKFISVTPGIRSDTEVEIKEGLSDNQTIVQNPDAVKIPEKNSSGILRFKIGG